MSAPLIGGLSDLNMESGVNGEMVAFCSFRAAGSDSKNEKTIVLLGQLTPDEMRAHALKCLEVAEAAEQDALVMREVVSAIDDATDRGTAAAASLINGIRERRRRGE